MYYASIGALALIIHITINFEALKNRQRHRTRISQTRYRHFLYVVTLFYLSDILWGFFVDQEWIGAAYVDTMVFFLSMVASVLLWTRFVVAFIENKGRFGFLLLSGGWTIFTFQLITLIINIFKPIVFEFRGDEGYQTLVVRNITLVLQMGLFFITAIYTLYIATRKRGETRVFVHTASVSVSVAAVIFGRMPSCYLHHSLIYIQG